MKEMLDQVKEGWNNPAFTSSMSSFESFCNMLGMERLPEFLIANRFSEVQDWSEQPLPEDGKALQAAILERSNVSLLTLCEGLSLIVVVLAFAFDEDIAGCFNGAPSRWDSGL